MLIAGEAFKNAGDAVVDGAKTAYNKTATFAQQHFDGTRREINTLEGVLQVNYVSCAQDLLAVRS